MDSNTTKKIIEGLVFSQSEPVTVESLRGILPNATKLEIAAALESLEHEYIERRGGFILVKTAGAYQFRTAPEIASWVLEFRRSKPARLSRAALEVLTITAYNQPVMRSTIEQIRGVESSAIIRSLMERELIHVVGKKEMAGRPLLYGTTKRFLEVFDLADLAHLPPLPTPEVLEGPLAILDEPDRDQPIE